MAARHATLPRESFWRAKLTTSDDLGIFSTHTTAFHNLRTTLMTKGDDILMTLKTNGEEAFTTPTTSDEDTFTTPVTTRDYLVTTMHDITNNACDDIDNLEQITVK